MGLDIDRIVEKDKAIDHIICSICMDVLDNPKQAPCQHSFCNDCIREWLDSGNATCPVDRQELSLEDLNQPRLLQEILNKLIIRCKNHQKGCRLMARYEDRPQLVEHEAENCSIHNNSFRHSIDKLKKNLKALEKKISEKDNIIFEKEQERKKLLENQKKAISGNEKRIKNLNDELSKKDEKINILEKLKKSYEAIHINNPEKENSSLPSETSWSADLSESTISAGLSENLLDKRYTELPQEILEVRTNLETKFYSLTFN